MKVSSLKMTINMKGKKRKTMGGNWIIVILALILIRKKIYLYLKKQIILHLRKLRTKLKN